MMTRINVAYDILKSGKGATGPTGSTYRGRQRKGDSEEGWQKK
ncbi:MAG: hypothetical protein ACOC5T_07565 [Elusimicrobiota bacterium]